MITPTINSKSLLFASLLFFYLLQPAQAQVIRLFEYPPQHQVVRLYLFSKDWSDRDSISVCKAIDSIITLAKDKGSGKIGWYAELFKLFHFAAKQNGIPSQEAVFLNKLEYFENSPFEEVAGTYHFLAGSFYYNHVQFEKAFHHLIQATDIFEDLGYQNIPLAAKISSDLFGFHYHFEDYKTALHFLEITIRYTDSLLSYPVFDVNNMGVTYLKMKDYAKAKETFIKVLQIAKAVHDTNYIGIGSGNYGNLLRLEGRYAQALPYLYTDLGLNQKTVTSNCAISCLYISYCLLRLDSIEKASRYLDLSLQLKPDWQWSSFGPNYYETKALYYQKTGDFHQASIYQDSLLYLKDSLKNLFSTRILMATSLKLKEEQMLANRKSALIEADNIRLVRNLVIAILLFAFVSVLFLFNQKRRKERVLFEEKQTKSDELVRIAQIKLEQYINGIREKNDLIENIGNQLTSLPSGKNGLSKEINLQVQKLNQSVILTEDDWTAFKNLFTEVWPQFFDQLRNKYPELSQSEIRLLALCKLHLSSRVMANMIGISIDSLRKSRYRLRKKYPQLLQDEEFKEMI